MWAKTCRMSRVFCYKCYRNYHELAAVTVRFYRITTLIPASLLFASMFAVLCNGEQF